ncbi:DUF309 domain-containing protein [Sulfitobacter geojensis]|uniref:DUF309 domain-containing protein n=1 Tax=Sulfitobacter geojensis TaxID=1342299 RepID=UPI000569A1FE|nr:DUF309 domain-containing protein [Sulfitobacter geojensis]NYI26669.1 hypothetical protein [Sulfitobacter geojensis]
MPDRSDAIPVPPYAYVPGQNMRHPEDWFDAIKDTVLEGMPAADLQHTAAFRAGLIYLDAGYYWECHEVLEAVWLQTPKGTAERDMVQALIQLANARLKVRMRRPRAAQRLCNMVEGHLQEYAIDQPILGVLPDSVMVHVAQVRCNLDGR